MALAVLACLPPIVLSGSEALAGGSSGWETTFPDLPGQPAGERAQKKHDRVDAAVKKIADNAQDVIDDNSPPSGDPKLLKQGKWIKLLASVLARMLQQDKLCPRCIPTGMYVAKLDRIYISKTIICWPDQREPTDPTPRIAGLLLHESYHRQNDWVRDFIYAPYSKHKDYKDSAAGTKIRIQKEIMYWLYKTADTLDEVAADLDEQQFKVYGGMSASELEENECEVGRGFARACKLSDELCAKIDSYNGTPAVPPNTPAVPPAQGTGDGVPGFNMAEIEALKAKVGRHKAHTERKKDRFFPAGITPW